MKAFIPIAVKIFGSSSIGLQRKILLANSLIISRLLYNVYTWFTFCNTHRKIINTMYMRVWRRICGAPKRAGNTTSDFTVRSALAVPSIDCAVRRARLMHFARLTKEAMPALNAMLQAPLPLGKKFPWLQTVIDDLQILRNAVGNKLASLPPPAPDLAQWWSLAARFPHEWAEIVKS